MNLIKPPAHPAKYSASVIATIRQAIIDHTEPFRWNVLDPFGGVGGIHQISDIVETWCIELEAEWAHQGLMDGWTYCGDFFAFDSGYATFWHGAEVELSPLLFDVVATSPTYGTRMADHHEAKDASSRITYRHKLGRPLSPNNSGAMQWGHAYRLFHAKAWCKVWALLEPGGLFLLNISDHIRKDERQPVTAWHVGACRSIGFVLEQKIKVETQRMGFGANRGARVDHESVLVFRKPK